MNDLLQPGQHLEADQLNAFIEGVLPEHERLESLAHLSECSHCRQVVFLARQAQQLQEPAAEKAAPAWHNWFRFSPTSMLGTATAALACALIVTLALHLYRATQTPTTENARIETPRNLPPATPQTEAPAAKPPAPRRVLPKAALPPPPPVAAAPVPMASDTNEEAVGTNSAVTEQRSMARKLAASPKAAIPLILHNRAVPSAGAIAGGEAQGRGIISLSKAAPAKATDTSVHSAATSDQAGAAPLPLPAKALPLSARTAAQSANQTVEISAVPQSAINSLSEDSETQNKRSKVHTLPSKLPLAASASNGRRMLAGDTAGALFLSKNGGKHWKLVKPQWQGKVILLALQTPSQSVLQEQKAEATVAGFQLTTDSGAVWVSEDGAHWQQR